VKTLVVKVGGGQLGDSAWLAAFAAAASLAARGARLCVVHGGGREINQLLGRLGLPSSFVRGRRVTGEAQLEAVRMALSGSVNKGLVRALRDAGLEAVGLSGEDGVLRAGLAEGGALGRVGIPESVGVRLLNALFEAGLVPVVSPLARGRDGAGLNVNADEAAAAIAGALGAHTLVFLTDVPGVLLEGRPLAHVTPGQLGELVASGAVHSGMLPKLSAAALATASVPDVRIGDLSSLLDETLGSRVVADAEAA
jgi:acetylglutamate kinase